MSESEVRLTPSGQRTLESLDNKTQEGLKMPSAKPSKTPNANSKF